MSADLHADFDSHHIEGYAREAMHRGGDPGAAHFKVPLFSHIEGNLYVGGCINGVELPHDFKHVLSLYPWGNYILGPDTARLVVRMYDSSDVPDPAKLDELADYVVGALQAGKTLVHCQAGLNRSNLIAALALIKLGRTPNEAIQLLRERRTPLVLCNAAFTGYLRSLEEKA